MLGSANQNVMIKATRAAGRSLVKDFREVENLQVSAKGAGDFVSKAIISSETIMRDMLVEARPTYGWLGKDGKEVDGADPTRRWIVSGLDGVTNFLHGLPHWAVSVALEHKGEIVSCVVFDPAKGELFWAEKGAGSWMNDTRIRASGRTKLHEGLFATGLPNGGQSDLPDTLRDLARILPACAGVRRWGAPSLDMAFVAAGRFDGYWERRMKPWDIAAGLLLVKEAGGFAEPIVSTNTIIEDGEVICANEALFERFASVIRAE